MLFSEGHGHKVVSTGSAETVGRVDDFVVDPSTQQVVAVLLKKTPDKDVDVLLWGDIQAFGQDAVTVTGADSLSRATEQTTALTGKTHELVGKRTLSSAGDELGKVRDVEFDDASGAITGILLKDSGIEGSRLVGVGSYAVVVEAE